MQEAEIRAIVAELLAEQQKLHFSSIDGAIQKAIVSTLAAFGIEEEDRRDLRADLQHLRRWRKSVEQAQSFTFKAVITIIVSGIVGALWLGVKVMIERRLNSCTRPLLCEGQPFPAMEWLPRGVTRDHRFVGN